MYNTCTYNTCIVHVHVTLFMPCVQYVCSLHLSPCPSTHLCQVTCIVFISKYSCVNNLMLKGVDMQE